jgi:hypothetical membrane protein
VTVDRIHPQRHPSEGEPVSFRHFLPLGIIVPVLYFGTLLVAASTWPGYSHVTRYASELGSAEAPAPWIFNRGIMLMGATCVLAALGFGAALRDVAGRRTLAIVAATCVALFGVGMFLGGMFPMPDPRHGGFGLALALVPAPLLMALAVRPAPRHRGLALFLVASFVLMAALLAVMMGVGGLVTRANVGLWQRANALTMFPWMGIAAWALLRRPGRPSPSR